MSNTITVTSLTFSKGKYFVVFSNGEQIETNEELIVKRRLVKDKELTDIELNEINAEAKWFKMYDLAVKYLQRGPKSVYLIRVYLQKKGATNEEIDNAINELLDHGLLNDEAYFTDLAEHYLRGGFGPLYIKKKGYECGISEHTMNCVLANFSVEQYIEYATNIYKKKKDTILGNDLPSKLKIKKYLLGRGYTYEIVDKVSEE